MWLGLPPSSSGEVQRTEEHLLQQIDDAIAERQSTFSKTDALKLPAVRRAVDLICTIGASFYPETHVDGIVGPNPPIVARPDPLRSRNDWTVLVLRSLVQWGNAYLLTGDSREYAIVLDPDAVDVDNSNPIAPLYRWQGNEYRQGQGFYHIRIGQEPGEAKGTGPLDATLPQLAVIASADNYASAFFGSNGIPHTVLTTDLKVTADEAKALRDAYIASRSSVSGVAALSQGYAVNFPSADPERAQMLESRDWGVTQVARLFGIPGPLLLVSGQSGSLTYTNVSQLVQSFARQTVLPMYLAPVEAMLTDLVSDPAAVVRYSTDELARTNVLDRVAAYQGFTGMGAMTAEEVRAAEGWDPTAPVDITPMQPVPEGLP
jgi:HK97 family phage portal protein